MANILVVTEWDFDMKNILRIDSVWGGEDDELLAAKRVFALGELNPTLTYCSSRFEVNNGEVF